MLDQHRSWQEELAIIDRTMKAISSVDDPEEMMTLYWDGVGDLIAIDHFMAVSRRNVEAPFYLITRSSRFVEQFNPWTQRDRLPKLAGGLLGEIIAGAAPLLLEDLPERLQPDDPAHFYLQGFQTLLALPHYDAGDALNFSIILLEPGKPVNHAMIPMLYWQGSLFGRGTQNLVLKNQLSAALNTLDRELQVVGNIQRSLLPSTLPQIPGFELAAHYATSSRAGGDYYDFFPLADGEWGLFIADVSGHGTPAAVLMAITHAIAHSQPGTHTPPGALLDYLNDQLARAYTRDGTFVTAFYAVLNPARRTLTYSSAGHNPPRLVRDGQVLSLDDAGSLPMGVLPGHRYDQATCQLAEGDLVLLYTDGIPEAMAPGEGPSRLFGLERLDPLLVDCGCSNAADCINRIRSAVAEFCENAPPTDDQTLIAMRVA